MKNKEEDKIEDRSIIIKLEEEIIEIKEGNHY